jgi:hypothetical protein
VGDARRAKVIWTKLKLRQLVPMNYTEALAPGKLPNAAPLLTDLPANPTYAQVLAGAGITAGSTDPTKWPYESSALLLLFLSKGSGGQRFSTDLLPPSALRETGGGLRQVTDAWGQPLVFYRWPADNPDATGSNPNPGAPYPDPLDPEGTLVDPAWNNQTNYTAQGGVWWFEQYCHRVHYLVGGIYTPQALYLPPVICSAGRNNLLGLVQNSARPSPLLPDTMSPDASNNDFDNIYSFRLRQGARGD